MYWNGYIEKVSTGTEDIINKCREHGLKTPEFYQEEDFRVVIWQRGENVPETSQNVPETSQSVPDKETELLNLIKENPTISRDKLSEILGISVRQVRNITNKFKNYGILTREGVDSGKWVIKK